MIRIDACILSTSFPTTAQHSNWLFLVHSPCSLFDRLQTQQAAEVTWLVVSWSAAMSKEGSSLTTQTPDSSRQQSKPMLLHLLDVHTHCHVHTACRCQPYRAECCRVFSTDTPPSRVTSYKRRQRWKLCRGHTCSHCNGLLCFSIQPSLAESLSLIEHITPSRLAPFALQEHSLQYHFCFSIFLTVSFTFPPTNTSVCAKENVLTINKSVKVGHLKDLSGGMSLQRHGLVLT